MKVPAIIVAAGAVVALAAPSGSAAGDRMPELGRGSNLAVNVDRLALAPKDVAKIVREIVRINRKQVAKIRALETKNAAQAAEIEALIEKIRDLEARILPDPPPPCDQAVVMSPPPERWC